MKLFDNYVKSFDLKDEMIKGKYHHSYRVQVLCELIAKELGFSDDDIKLVSLCGMFHDIARFKQVDEYHTFNDFESFDHGDEGAKIFNDEFASKLNLDAKQISLITKSIKYHNKYQIGDDVSKEELPFCKIVRDADKIDILYQLAITKNTLRPTDGEISKKCHQDFMKKRSLMYQDTLNNTDKNLLSLAYIWDINYDVSKKIIGENKYYQKIESRLNSEIYTKYFKLIYKELEVKKC